MATGEHVTEWSTTAACTPAGSDTIGSTLDDELRQLKATIYSASRLDEQAKTTAYTAVLTDFDTLLSVAPSVSTLTVSLAAAATTGLGWRVTVRHDGSVAGVLIDGAGTEQIDGSLTYLLADPGEAVELVSDGVDRYHVAGAYVPKDNITDYVTTFDAGTVMVFYQNAAPTGWTRVDATSGGRAIKLADSGDTGGTTGGSVTFDTVFGLSTTGTTGAHTHTISTDNHNHGRGPSGGGFEESAGAPDYDTDYHAHNHGGATGSDGDHSHTMDIRVNYAVCILASKDA